MATKQKEIKYKEAREKGAQIIKARQERDKKSKNYQKSVIDFQQKELAKKKNKKEK